jgi:uncharacterized protein (DUF433 family)
MNKVVIGYGCTVCGLMSSRDRWMGHTAVEVLGPDSVDAMDYSGVGEIAEPAVRADLNHFWICPDCDTQVHGNQITVEHCLMEHGKVEEVEDEDYPELTRVQIHMSIELDLPVEYTREEIMEALRVFIYNSVESGMPADKLAHQILIAGLDF